MFLNGIFNFLELIQFIFFQTVKMRKQNVERRLLILVP